VSDAAFPPVQLSTFVNGDQLVFRANSGEELAEIIKSVTEKTDEILDGLNATKKAFIAEGVFTGDSSKKRASDRKADTPPPIADVEVPTCKHGPMLDLAGKGYKKRWYCPERGRDRECWARD